MTNKYEVTFLMDSGEEITRGFRMINESTPRARSVYLNYAKLIQARIKGIENPDEIEQEILSLSLDVMNDQPAYNAFMKSILIGDHNDIDWFNASDVNVTDKIYTDFFSIVQQEDERISLIADEEGVYRDIFLSNNRNQQKVYVDNYFDDCMVLTTSYDEALRAYDGSYIMLMRYYIKKYKETKERDTKEN